MADEFDPIKRETLTSTVDVTQKPDRKIETDLQDEDLLDLGIKTNSKTQNSPSVEYSNVFRQESDATDTVYDRLDTKKYSNKTSMRSTHSANENSAHVKDQARQHYKTDDQEYYAAPPRNGLAATLDRIVQHFPLLSIFYRPSSEQTAAYDYSYDETNDNAEENNGAFDDDEAPELVVTDEVGRELTDVEIALVERYSDSSRTKIIQLQKKETTKPVDVAVHNETYTIYLCDIGRSLIEIYNFNGNLEHVIDDRIISHLEPSAIAVGDDGTIIVASSIHHRLHLYSPSTSVDENQTENDADNEEEFYYQQYKLGSKGSKLHQFQDPSSITVDPNTGYLYVCDRGNYRIQVIRPEGICERVIELVVNGNQPFCYSPVQLAHQRIGDQLVCLIGEGDAICFIPKIADGTTEVEPFYIFDNDGNRVHQATSLAVDDQDRIFISDTENHRIVVCSPQGEYLGHFGGEGDQPGQLKFPAGLTITPDGTLVVADSGNQRIQLFGLVDEKADSQSPESTSDYEKLP